MESRERKSSVETRLERGLASVIGLHESPAVTLTGYVTLSRQVTSLNFPFLNLNLKGLH